MPITKKPIPNNVAATGAVDKEGNIKAIGGLHEKIIASVEAENKILVLPADRNWNSAANQVSIFALKKYVSDEKLAEFRKQYASKLKYHPVKNQKDLINLLENGF